MEQVAYDIYTNSQICVNYRKNFVGSRSELGERKDSQFLFSGQTYTFNDLTSKNSILLHGLDHVQIKIPVKINHLLIRNCHHLQLELAEGTISGTSILGGSKITIKTPIQNMISIESSSDISINGMIAPETTIYVSSSQDISINSQRLMINPFTRGTLTVDNFFNTPYIPPIISVLVDQTVIEFPIIKTL